MTFHILNICVIKLERKLSLVKKLQTLQTHRANFGMKVYCLFLKTFIFIVKYMTLRRRGIPKSSRANLPDV